MTEVQTDKGNGAGEDIQPEDATSKVPEPPTPNEIKLSSLLNSARRRATVEAIRGDDLEAGIEMMTSQLGAIGNQMQAKDDKIAELEAKLSELTT